LRTVLAWLLLARLVIALLTRLMLTLFTRLIGLLFARLTRREGWLRLLLLGWLLLRRRKTRLCAEIREVLALVVAIVVRRHLVLGARLRLVLAKLLLRGGDQPEIMFGVLVVILGSDGIAGGARIARKLHVFLGDVRGGAADLDIGAIRFEHPCHRVLATPIIIVVITIVAAVTAVVIPVTHPLVVIVVLTVSHVSPLQPIQYS
jgi:hypothetical protein